MIFNKILSLLYSLLCVLAIMGTKLFISGSEQLEEKHRAGGLVWSKLLFLAGLN